MKRGVERSSLRKMIQKEQEDAYKNKKQVYMHRIYSSCLQYHTINRWQTFKKRMGYHIQCIQCTLENKIINGSQYRRGTHLVQSLVYRKKQQKPGPTQSTHFLGQSKTSQNPDFPHRGCSTASRLWSQRAEPERRWWIIFAPSPQKTPTTQLKLAATRPSVLYYRNW